MKRLASVMRRGVAESARRVGLTSVVVGFMLATIVNAFGADFDGSKVLICATIDAMDCVSGDNCTKGRPGDMGAPAFLRIDFAKKAIVGAKHTTPIVSMDKADEQILLQGKEQGYGWTLALDQEGGNFSATLVNRDGVFVLFGSCTNKPDESYWMRLIPRIEKVPAG